LLFINIEENKGKEGFPLFATAFNAVSVLKEDDYR